MDKRAIVMKGFHFGTITYTDCNFRMALPYME